MAEQPHAPLREWRVPPWQTAALILIATGLLALVIYGRLSAGPRIAAGLLAVACLVCALVAARYLLVAANDGIWVRRLVDVQHVTWPDVAQIELAVGARNATTVRITRHSGTFVDVPPSLVLPTRPTSIRKVRSIMAGAAMELTQLAAEQTRR